MVKRTNKLYYNRTNTCDGCGTCFEEIKKLGDHPRKEYNKEGNWTGKWTCTTCYNNKIRHGTYDKPEKIYNDTNTCSICNKNLIPGNARRERDEKGNVTRWLCFDCWKRYDYNKRPDSHNNIIKSLRDRRIGNLDPNSNTAKGDRGEELTCRWRRVKSLGKENDNYTGPMDHSRDSKFGIIQTKLASYNSREKCWFLSVANEYNKEFDYEICYCISEDDKSVERLYIFPKKEVISRNMIGIVKNPTRGRYSTPCTSWYDDYRVNDKNILTIVNKIYQEILEEEKKL